MSEAKKISRWYLNCVKFMQFVKNTIMTKAHVTYWCIWRLTCTTLLIIWKCSRHKIFLNILTYIRINMDKKQGSRFETTCLVRWSIIWFNVAGLREHLIIMYKQPSNEKHKCIKTLLNQQDLVSFTIKYHTCNNMTNPT